MTNPDGTTTELCGCILNRDGKCVTPCQDCLRAALAERTHGIQSRISDTFFRQLSERIQRTRTWLSSL